MNACCINAGPVRRERIGSWTAHNTRFVRSAIALCVALAAQHAFAQTAAYEWIRVDVPSPPGTSWEIGYDVQQQLTLALNANGPDNPNTWMWNGNLWMNTGFPGPTYVVGMIFYPATGLVFHDNTGAVYRLQALDNALPMQTWVFIAGVGWVQVNSSGPVSAGGFGWAYDAARQKSVVFGGGIAGGLVPAYTWEWDGAAWTAYDTQANGPGRRDDTAMAYDAARGVVVLFGGRDEQSQYLADTWTWDGTHWTQHAASGPSARWGHAMIYDPDRQKVLLFGGTEYDGSTVYYLNDLWEWDGAAWTPITPAGTPPPARTDAGFTYNLARHEAIVFSGWAEFGSSFPYTWRLRTREKWVDFNYDGVEDGSFDMPFNTIAEAVAALPPGGHVHIKPGTTSETATLSKELRFDTPLGAATIGQP